MAHDVFISYPSEDKTIADAVCATLERKGIRCWIAPRDVLPGVSWGEALIEAINQSRMVVLVFSSHTNRSRPVEREVERAVHKGLTILPIRVEEVMPSKTLEFMISSTHWLDALTPPLEQHLEYLAKTVRLLLERANGAKAHQANRGVEANREVGYESIANHNNATELSSIMGNLSIPSASLPTMEENLDTLYHQAYQHWLNLETREARRLLHSLLERNPTYKHSQHALDAYHLLHEARPDYRESVLVVVSHQAFPLISDQKAAMRLCEEIDRRGDAEKLRWAALITDEALLNEAILMKCPLISVGGPVINKITGKLSEELPGGFSSLDNVFLHHDLQHGKRCVALWGIGALETTQAVDCFISTGQLNDFLALIWADE